MAESIANIPPITLEESLARFVLFRSWIRSSDGKIRQDAFVPHPYANLSVTRHLGISEDEIWELGQIVADARPAILYGRADLEASVPLNLGLRIEPTLQPKNHANISGWPQDKASQKMLATELAARARFIASR